MISAIQVPNIAFNTFKGRNLELVIKKLPSKDLQKRHITSRYCHSNYSTGDKHPTPPSTKAQVLSGHTQQLLIFFNIKCKRKPFPISVLLSLLLYENNLPAFRLWLWLLCFHVIWMQWKISGHGYQDKSQENSFVVPRRHEMPVTPVPPGGQLHAGSEPAASTDPNSPIPLHSFL